MKAMHPLRQARIDRINSCKGAHETKFPDSEEAVSCDINPGTPCLMEATRFFIWNDRLGTSVMARCPAHVPMNKIYKKKAKTITRDEYLVARVLDT